MLIDNNIVFHCTFITLAEQEAPVEMKKCSAYEITKLNQEKVVTKKNEAYETVKIIHDYDTLV